MIMRHQIASKASLIGFSNLPQNIEEPGVPQNLTGRTEITTGNAVLTWDKPTSGGKVFYYKIYENGSHVANSSDRTYPHANPQNNDEFKVTAVGVLGLESGKSNAWTYTGDEALSPNVSSVDSSLHVEWNDISGSDQISFEGYNVYLDGVRQNNALLNSDVGGYSFFSVSVGTTYTVGVSFEHDGGVESTIFTIDGTVAGEGISYTARIAGTTRVYPLISPLEVGDPIGLADIPLGLAVKEGTEYRCTPNFSPGAIDIEYDRSLDVDSYFLWRVPHGYNANEARMNHSPGCGDDGFLSLQYNRITNFAENIDDTGTIYASIFHSAGFQMITSDCGGPTDTSFTVTIQLTETDVLDFEGGPFSGFRMWQNPTEDDELDIRDDTDSGEVIFYWIVYPPLLFHDLYIKSDGASSYPTDPYNSSKLKANDNMFRIADLSNGTYNAKMQYFLGDKSTMLLESNEVTFTIS